MLRGKVRDKLASGSALTRGGERGQVGVDTVNNIRLLSSGNPYSLARLEKGGGRLPFRPATNTVCRVNVRPAQEVLH
jgi:hypothetical protein